MNKNTIISIFIIIVVLVGGYWIFSQNTPPALAPADENPSQAVEADDSIIDTLQEPEDATADDDDNDDSAGADDASNSSPAADEPAASGDESQDETKTESGTSGPDQAIKSFDISGKNFEFSIKEIRVKKGDTVRVSFSSESGFHDWVVDEFSARTKQLSAGQSDMVEFTADQTGEFEYYCSVGSHRQMGMVGKLIVE